MISRIWHGYTTTANADAYEALLKSEIFIGIKDRQMVGYKGIQLFRRNVDSEVQFITVMWFESIDAVRVHSQAKTMKLRSFLQKREHCFRNSTHVRNIMKSEQK